MSNVESNTNLQFFVSLINVHLFKALVNITLKKIVGFPIKFFIIFIIISRGGATYGPRWATTHLNHKKKITFNRYVHIIEY